MYVVYSRFLKRKMKIFQHLKTSLVLLICLALRIRRICAKFSKPLVISRQKAGLAVFRAGINTAFCLRDNYKGHVTPELIKIHSTFMHCTSKSNI